MTFVSGNAQRGVNAGAAIVVLKSLNAQAVDLGSAATTVNDVLELSAAEIAEISAAGGSIVIGSDADATNITASSISLSADVDFTTSNVLLASTGDITSTNGANEVNVNAGAGSLTFQAGGSIGAAGTAFGLEVATVSAAAGTTDDLIEIEDIDGDLTVSRVTIGGTDFDNVSASDTVTIVASGGNLSTTALIGQISTTGDNDKITLTSSDGSVAINGSVTSDGGEIEINADTGITFDNVDADVVSFMTTGSGGQGIAGLIDINADVDGDGSGTFLISDAGATLSTDSNTDANIDISGGDFSLTADATIDAGTGTLLIAPGSGKAVTIGVGAADFGISNTEINFVDEASSLVIGQTNGTTTASSITIDGAFNLSTIATSPDNVTLITSGAISNAGGTLTMPAAADLLLLAQTGIGSSGNAIATAGLSDIAAQSNSGGVFVTNSGSGDVNITTVTDGVANTATGITSTTGGDIEVVNNFATGTLTVSQAVTAAAAGAVTLTTASGNVQVESGVTSDSGMIDVNSGEAFTLADGISVSSTSGSIDISTTGANALAVNGNVTTGGTGNVTLDGSDSIVMDGDSLVQSSAGNVTIDSANGGVTIDVVSSLGGGNIIVAAGSDGTADASDDLTLTDAVTASGSNGNISLFAGDTISVPVVTISAAGTGDVLLSAGTDFNEGGTLQNASDAGNVILADGSIVSSQGGNITLRAPGNVQISTVNADSDAGGAIGNVIVTADFDGVASGLSDNVGEITEVLMGEAANITADSLALRAATGIGSIDDLNTTVSTVAFSNGTSGNVNLTNSTGLTVGSFDGLTSSSNVGAGTTTIVASGAITFAHDTSSDGTLTAQALESAATNSDNIAVNAAVTVQSTAGNMIFEAGDRISLAATATVMATSSSAMITLDSGFGDTDSDGAMTLDGTISGNATNGVVTLDLNAQQGATQAGTGTVTAAGLQLLSTGNDGAFSLGTSTTNDVSTLSANTAGAITFRDTDTLTIGTVTTVGISTSNDDVAIQTGDTLTIDDAVSIGTGRFTINSANGATQVSGDDIAAQDLVLLGTGTFTLDSVGNDVDTVAADLDPGVISYTDVDDLSIGTVGSTIGINTGIIGTTDGGTVTINATSGTITVNQAINTQQGTGGGLVITGDVDLNASLTAGAGTITLNGNDVDTADIVIAANLIADGTIDLDARRDILVQATVQTTGTGSDIRLTADSDADTVGGLRVEGTGFVDSADEVTLEGSDLFVIAGTSEAVQIDVDNVSATNNQVQAGGAILIQDGVNAPATADTVINGRVAATTTTATITITAEQDVLFGADGDLIGLGGTITVTADTRSGNNGGTITMSDGTMIDATDGLIDFDADGNISLGQLTTTNTTDSAATITTTSGAILDITAAETSNISAGTTVLRAATGIGDAAVDNSDIDVSVGSLAATTSTGDISISDDAALDITTVDGLSGITITTGGAGDDILIREGNAAGSDDLTISQTISNSGSGNVTLFADGADSQNDNLNINASISASGGDVVIVSYEDVDFGSAPTVSTTGAGTIAIHAGRVFNFGAALTLGSTTADILEGGANEYIVQTAGGTITLTATRNIELETVNAGMTGTVIVTADSDLDGLGSIIDALASEAANITALSLALRAGDGVGSGEAADDADIDLVVTNVAAFTNTGDIHLQNTGGLTVGTVDSLAGVTITDDGNVNGGSDITIRAASPLTVSAGAPVVNNAGGNITLAAEGSDAADDLTINDAVTALGGDGNISLFAGDTISLAAITIGAAGVGMVVLSAGSDFNNATVRDGNADGDVLMTSGAIVQSEGGNITLQAPDDVQISIVNADSDAGSTIGDIIVTADFAGPDTSGGAGDTYDSDGVGAITDVLTGEAVNLTGNLATLTAATGIGSADDLDTDLAQVNVANSTSGSVMITELAGAGDNALEVTGVTNVTGNIDVRTEDGALTLSGAASTTTVGTITFVAGDSDNDGNGDLAIEASVSAATGQVTLTSAGNDVTFTAAGDVTTTTGEIEVNAGATGVGVITMTDNGATDATVLNAGSGLIDLNGVGDVTLGSVVTTNATVDAVNIASTTGAILDGGDFAVDIVADGGTTTLVAGASIGTAGNGLDTTIDRLNATSSAGDVHVDETNGLTAVSVTATGAGNDVDISSTTGDILVGVVTAPDTITLTTIDGGIEELSGGEADADADLVATTLNLDATVGIGDDATIEITATSIAADTANNNIDLLNQNPGAAVTATSLTTGTGTIDFVQTGNEALTVTLAQTTDGTITIQNTGDTDTDTLTLTAVTAGGSGDVNATTLTAGDVLVGAVIADANTVTVTSAGAINDAAIDTAIDVTVGTGTIDLNAVDGIGNTAALELAGTSISADTSAGAIDLDNVLATDVSVTSLTTVGSTITFDQSGGGSVSFDGLVSSGNAGIAGDDIVLTAANGDLTINAAVESRTADVTVTSTENVIVTAAGSITSIGGDVVLNSDTDTATSAGGGIRVLGIVTSAGGNITLGGGADPAVTNAVATAGSDSDGIKIDGGTLDAAAGNISLRGFSAIGDGVEIQTNAVIQTTSGNVSLQGSSTFDDGIALESGAVIETTSGAITLNGTTTSVSGDDGIKASDTGTTVTSATGSISFTGMASTGDGVDISAGAVISSTSTATIMIDGTSTAMTETGVKIRGANTQITSVDGNITITGTDNNTAGVFVTTGAEISSTGTGADAASITITGTGDAGIDIISAGTLITSVDGNILLDGTGNTFEGIVITDATISATGTTADAATITLDGVSTANDAVLLRSGSTITSVAGDIQLTGDASTATDDGIELEAGSTVSSTGSGAVVASITLLGTGGTNNDGIHIDGSVTSVDGNIQLAGTTSDADGDDGIDLDVGLIEATGSGAILLTGNGRTNGIELNSSITSNSGAITLQSVDDTIEFQAPASVMSNSGSVMVTADMTVGGASGQLLMADGSEILAGSGTIDIDAEGDITIGLLQTTDASSTAVTIDSATGAVIDAGNASVLNVDATAGRLVINAVTGIGAADTLETNVASLDVDNSTSGNIDILETDTVTVFDAQQATVGNIQIIAGGTLTVDNGGVVANAVATTGAGSIVLSATGIDSNLVINDGVQSATGTILLTADNDVFFDADGDVTSTTGNVTVTADADSATDSGGTDQGSITMTDGAVINAGSGLVDLNANEDILLSSVTTTTEVQATSVVGSILDNGDSDADVTAAMIALRALNGIGTDANSIDTVSDVGAGSLTIATLTDSGDIHIANTGALIVGTVDSLVGVTVSDAAAGGDDSGADNISLMAAGALTVNNDVTNSDGGDVTLTATDSGAAGDDVTVATGVSIEAADGNGNITLNAGDNLALNGTASVLAAGAGVVTVTADAGSVDAGGAISMADGSTVTSGSGLIDLNATDNITLGGLLTTGNVTIDTITGEVIDGGDANVDVTADTLSINANGGIGESAGSGADAAIETTISTLNATTTDGTIQIDESDGATLASVTAGGAGDVRIVTTTGNLSVQSVSADGDLVALTATAGAITDGSAGETENITADEVVLRAATGIGNASTNDADLDLAVASLAATTATGDISLSESAGLLVTTVDGLSGVSITAGGAGDDILIREGQAAGADELRILQDVSSSGAGDITIAAGGDSANDDLDIDANITSGGGNILIVSFDDIDFSAAPTMSTMGTGTIAVHAGRTFDFVSGVSAAGTGTATAAILQAAEYTIQTDQGDITLTANQNVELDSISSTSGTVIVTADADSTGTGSISDTLASESANITASAVALRAAEGIGLADDIDTSVATISATNSTSGSIQVDNAAGSDLTIATVNGLAGIMNGGGAILVNNLNGTLTVDDAVATVAGTGGALSLSGSLVINAPIDAGQFDVTLNGNDNGDDDLIVNADLTTDQALTLSASRDIVINATVQTTGAGSDITATADNDNDGIGGVQVTAAGQVNSADAVILTGADLFADAVGSESVQIDSNGATAQVLAAGDITIGPGAGAAAATDVEVNGLVQSTGAATTITITANRDVLFGVDGDVTRSDAGASGLISVFSDQTSIASTGGVITMADGTVINGGGGQVEVIADGRLTLGQIITTDLINIGSVAADVIDGGDTGGADLIASSLAIAGETGVGTDADSIETQVSALSGQTDSGDFHVSNTGDLAIDTVNLTVNVAAILGMVTVDGVQIEDSLDDNSGNDNITITTSDALTVNQTIVNNDGGNIALTSTNNGGANDHLTISADVTALGGTGSIDLNAGTDLTIDSDAVVSTVGTGAITGDAERAVSVSGSSTVVRTVEGTISLTANAGGHSGNFVGITVDDATVSTTSGAISLTGTGGNTGDANHGVVLTNTATITSTAGASAGAVSINGTGGVGAASDGVNLNNAAVHTALSTVDATISITGNSATDDGVALTNSAIASTGANGAISINGTTTGIGTDSDGVFASSSAISTTGDSAAINISGVTAGDDGVELTDDSDVTTSGAATITVMGTTTGSNGADSDGVLIGSTGGDVTITSAAGAISITGSASGASGDGVEIEAGIGLAIDANGGAGITITGTGDGAESAVQIDSPIESESGTITVRSLNGESTTDDITFGAGGDITSTSGTILIDADNAGNTADVFMADGAVINAGSGQIEINADVNVTLGQLITTNSTTTAVQITSATGGVIDGGDLGGADIISASGRTVIDAATGIGAADALETSFESIDADTSTGAIDLDNSLASTTTVISLTTVGGTVNFDQTGGGDLRITGNVTSGAVGTVGGNIELTSTAGLTAAGTSTISSNVGTGGLLSINEATIDAGATILVGAGDVTLNGSGQDTIINADITTATTATFTATRDVIIGATITTTHADADIIINANTDDDTAVGAGGVQLQTAGQLVAGRDVALTGSDLFVTNGAGALDSIEIQNDGAADQIVANRDISLTSRAASPAGADILVAGELLATNGSINIDATDRTVLNDNVDAGTDITFQDAVDISADITVTAGNDVTFFSTVDELALATGSDVIVNADGVTRFNAEVGGASALESLTTSEAGSTELEADVTVDNGAITFNDSVLLTGSISVTNTSASSINFNSTLDSQIDEHNNLVLTAATGEVVFDGDVGASTGAGTDDLMLGTLTITSAVEVTFGNNDGVSSIRTDGAIDVGSATTIGAGGITFDGVASTTTIETTSDTIRLNGAVTLNTDLRIDTDETAAASTGGATVTFTSDTPIDSQASEGNDLTIDAGTAQILFNEDIGNAAAGSELGRLVIEEATAGVTFGVADTETPGTGGSGPVNVISLVGDGALSALDVGSVTTIGGSGIVFNGGPDVTNTLLVETTGDDVRINGAVVLNSSVEITTGAGDGDVTFTNDSPIDSQTGESNNLTLTAGTGSVFINEDIGATESLGALTITRADGGVVFGEADAETPGDGSTGPVNTVSTNDAINIGSTNAIAGGIVLNGGASGIAFQTTGDNVRLNGAVVLQSNASIDTGDAGGDITFTSDSTIDSGDGTTAAPLGTTIERNDLFLDAGDGAVFFNASIGNTQRINDLTIDRAAGGVTFGAADTATTGAAGPVASVATDGAIDIGSGTTDDDVITGGIILNGAVVGISFQTSSDTVRLNGPVTLNSSVNIDTVNADVTFTNDASIDGQAGESNSLTINAGTARVLFNENIGETSAVGGVIVEQADGGVFFGTAEVEAVNGDAGSVDIVRTNGDSDIGSLAAITGGISLNAGPGAGNVFEWTTDGNSSRFNGVVTLDSSDVRISSGAAAGDVTFEDDLLPEANETVDLTLTAGTGNIVFGDVVGTTTLRFDDITVMSAADVTAQQAVETTTFAQTDGTGTTTFNGTLNTTDLLLAGVDINTSGITFNGAVTTTGDARVFLTNQGGTLTIAAGATFTVDNTFVQDGTGDVVVNANITTTNDEIRFSPTTDPTADVQAAASITLADGTVLATGGNADIRLRAEGDIRLSRLVTSSVDGLISVQSDAGAIIDNGDTGGADIVARNAALRAATGIGDDGLADPALNVAAADLPSATDPKIEASAIDTQVGLIAASNSTSGDIQISNTVGGLLTIGTVDGLSGITNDDDDASDDTVADGPNGGVIWITNASPIDVSSQAAPNSAEGVRNSAGGSVILTATDSAGAGDDLQIFAPVEAMRGTGSLLLNAGDDLTLESHLLTAIGSTVTLRDRAGNIDLNAGNVLTIGNNSELFDIQTGSLLEDAASGADTSVISQAHRETDFQTNRQIRYTQGPDATDLVLESGALLATNIVHQIDPATGNVVDNRILSNSGVIADFEPLLVEETFVTDQVRSDGYARISGRFGRTLDTAMTGGLDSEVNFRLLVAWGDDTFSFRHLTGATGDALPEIVNPMSGTLATGETIIDPADDPMGVTTSRTFFFEHFYDGSNLPDPENPGSPIQIRVFLQGDPNIVQVDANDRIAAYDNSTELLGGETPESTSFLANTDQFLISELLSPDLDAANLGEFGTGLGARVDTYRAPSMPGEQIDGIRNPAFNTVKPNPFGASTNLTTGLPAIVDFQFEEAAKVAFDLNLADQPNSVDASVTANVPGSGVDSSTAGFVFDLSPEVPTLEFPKVVEVLEAFVTTITQKDDDGGATNQARQSDETAATERVVWLKVLRPTGETVARVPAIVADNLVYSPLSGGGFRVMRVVEEVPLDEEVLDNLPKLVFEKLPDGQYQIWLQEPGEKDKRFVMDVTIRDGRPADDKAGARDRPPTSLKKPVNLPAAEEEAQQGPAKETSEKATPGISRKVSALGTSGSMQTDRQADGFEQAWSHWGQRPGAATGDASDRIGMMARLSDDITQPFDSVESADEEVIRNDNSSESMATMHPVAASVLLAAGSVLSKRKQNNWEDRVDDTMAQWDKVNRDRKS
tara:strand:+ start:236 stop:20809 length:20574 start_codon:yes stop_codon:yes gene_type:complete